MSGIAMRSLNVAAVSAAVVVAAVDVTLVAGLQRAGDDSTDDGIMTVYLQQQQQLTSHYSLQLYLVTRCLSCTVMLVASSPNWRERHLQPPDTFHGL